MFGKPGRRARKRLEQHGVQATGTILEVLGHGMTISSGPETWNDASMVIGVRMRVEPEGRPAFEVERKLRFAGMQGKPLVGQTFPVVFDPDDPQELMIDESPGTFMLAALKGAGISAEGIARYERISAAAQAGASPQEIQALAGTPPAQEDPLAQLERLADLRDRGVLSEEEFAAQKAKLLGGS